MKQKIVLQFPSVQMLWKFASFVHSGSIEINTTTKTLSCELLECEIETAQEKYQATILKQQSSAK